MAAKSKAEFIENWNHYANELTRLGHSSEKPATWGEIKRLREEIKSLVAKVADECYGEDNPGFTSYPPSAYVANQAGELVYNPRFGKNIRSDVGGLINAQPPNHF